MAWTNIPTTDIDQDSPVTQTLMTALRDNIEWVNAYVSRDVITTSTAASEFTLDSSYDIHLFTFQEIIPVSSSFFGMRTSEDGGSTFATTGYRRAFSSIQLDSSPIVTDGGSVITSLCNLSDSAIDDAGSGLHGLVFVHGTTQTGPVYTIGDVGYQTSTSYEGVRTYGVRTTTNVVDAVQFTFTSGNIASGIITHYAWRNG